MKTFKNVFRKLLCKLFKLVPEEDYLAAIDHRKEIEQLYNGMITTVNKIKGELTSATDIIAALKAKNIEYENALREACVLTKNTIKTVYSTTLCKFCKNNPDSGKCILECDNAANFVFEPPTLAETLNDIRAHVTYDNNIVDNFNAWQEQMKSRISELSKAYSKGTKQVED